MRSVLPHFRRIPRCLAQMMISVPLHLIYVGFYAFFYTVGIGIFAIGVVPGLYVGYLCAGVTEYSPPAFWGLVELALAIAMGYVAFCVSVLCLLVCISRLVPFRGWEGMKRFKDVHSCTVLMSGAVLILAEYLVLPLLRGTPLLVWFYRGLGAKIGRGTVIASTRISDCDILEVGDDCILGGDCVINGHSAEGNNMIRRKVTIGNNVTIGQYTTILPGACIEDGVIVGANSLVPKNRRLKRNQTYGGVPAVRLSRHPRCVGPAPKSPTRQTETHNDLLPKSSPKHNFDLLLESYRLRSAEIISIENTLTATIVASLSSFAGIILYSINGNQPKLLAFLPMLVSISGIVICSLVSGMNDLGFHLAKCEKCLTQEGFSCLTWETSHGAMGNSRTLRLPGIMITLLFATVYAVSVYLTFWGSLITDELFLDYPLRQVAAVTDIVTGLGCGVSFIYLILQQRSLSLQLEKA
jgi:acetyltransferase-like isoleucine patch superfamily enzyme